MAAGARQTNWPATLRRVDALVAIASKRDERRYASGRAISDDVVTSILDAGRLAGSARNRQLWRFIVVESDERKAALAQAVYVAENILDSGLVVAIATPAESGAAGKNLFLDAGRASQNMMLAAWSEGILSCPNGIPDVEGASAALALGDDEQPLLVISFGYPASTRDPHSRSAQEWSQRADRKPLEDIVKRL